MPALTVAADPEGAAEAAAELLLRLVSGALVARGEAHVALAGGRTPRRVYELLHERLVHRGDVHLWFSDERVVDPGSPESNLAMVGGSLLAGATISERRLHRIPVEHGAEEAAALYAAELAAVVPPAGVDGLPTLDVALLGLGEDGHTASLFADGPGLTPGSGWAVAVSGAPKPPPERVTLTVELLAAARAVVFLAVGAEKRPAVEAVLSGVDPAVPASLVAGGRSELIVDAEAAPEGDLELGPPREPTGVTGRDAPRRARGARVRGRRLPGLLRPARLRRDRPAGGPRRSGTVARARRPARPSTAHRLADGPSRRSSGPRGRGLRGRARGALGRRPPSRPRDRALGFAPGVRARSRRPRGRGHGLPAGVRSGADSAQTR
ncbi:MAG: 6-phosphogluconolactonase [Thermoleophilaceae bacterium]